MRGLPRSERPRLKKLVRIGTLNVGSLTGKSREVADVMKRMNIQVLRLQETRWKGAKAREIGEGGKLYNNGDDIKRNGVAIAVAESLEDSVSAVSRINSRIMAIRIDTEEGYWTIISVYAPQAGCPVYEKDELYLNLDEAIRSVSEGDYLTIADPEGPIQQTWNNAVKVILGCAKETLGETQGSSRGDKEAWFGNDEVQQVVREKKLAYKRWQKTRALENLAAYKTSKRLAKAAVAKANKMEMDALYGKLDSREGEKFVFRLAKARNRATQDIGVVKSVRNSEGAILRKPGEVRRRWKEYFDRLLNEEFARGNSSHLEATAGPIKLWTEDEVRIAIGKMKVGKATGPDGVPIEAWKALGEHGIKWLTRFLNTVTAKGRIPDAWRRSTIAPIFKQKGDAMDCSNYRGIRLTAHTMKLYERLVDSRLRELVPISEEQFGFMPERSTTDAIFIARQIMEKYREKRRPCYLAFLDLEKAFDRLPRKSSGKRFEKETCKNTSSPWSRICTMAPLQQYALHTAKREQ
nr:Endonuclease exonuclease phosphatase and RNA-directed DNA polymerase (reverse transcriptase) domain containing protein [Haemonchus contortus]